MIKKKIIISCFIIVFHSTFLWAQDSINLFTASEWQGNVATGAVMEQEKDGAYAIKGVSKSLTYGAMHGNIKVDFENQTELEIDVSKVKGKWYLLIEDQSFKSGFVYIEPDTYKRGTFKYNLQAITGFRNRRTVHLVLGISSSSSIANDGCFVVVKKLVLNKSKSMSKDLKTNLDTYYQPLVEHNTWGWDDTHSDG